MIAEKAKITPRSAKDSKSAKILIPVLVLKRDQNNADIAPRYMLMVSGSVDIFAAHIRSF